MPDVKIFTLAYNIRTADTTEVEKAVGGPKTATGLDYFKLLSNHFGKVVAKAVDDCTKAHRNDFGHDAHSLMIFCAPEFLFKDRDAKPFPRDVLFNGLEYLKTQMPARDDLLVLPGTVWWWESATKKPGDKSEKVIIHNTLPIIRNKKIYRTWQKEKLSPIDGLETTCEQWDRDNQAVAAALDKTQDPIFEVPVGNLKLKVGLEVCLDHMHQVLKKRAQDDLDVHILIACGMNAIGTSIAVRDGGIFVRCDGHPQTLGFEYAQRHGTGYHPTFPAGKAAFGGYLHEVAPATLVK